ncbi:MAG: hypothetical protein ACYS99_16840, partial [Planctomycetota bacterium]
MLIEILCAVLQAASGDLPQPAEWTVAPHRGGGGRVLFAADPVLRDVARNPGFTIRSGAVVRPDEKGKVEHSDLQSGWAYTAYESESAKTVLVTGRGFHSLFVNGERFVGDFYRHGLLRLPIPLQKGVNHLLVRAIRGEFTFRLLPAEGRCSLSPKDPTLP